MPVSSDRDTMGEQSSLARRLAGAEIDIDWRQTAYLCLLIIVVPTIGLLVLRSHLGFLNPPINLDLLIIYQVSILIGRSAPRLAVPIAVLGLSIVLAIQIVMAVGLIYVDDPALIKEYLSFAQYWPWKLIAFWFSVGLTTITGYGFLLARVDFPRAKLLPVFLLLVALLAVDLIGRTSIGYAAIKMNLATSSTARALKTLRAWSRSTGFIHTAHVGASMASQLQGQTPLPNRILSISVESYGVAKKDGAFNRAIVKPLQQALSADYIIQTSTHAFKGATLSGEIRELCGLRSAGTPTRADGLAIGPSCAPSRLVTRGYRTMAVHGNSRFFYNRGELYPAMGFTSSSAYEDMLSDGREVCRTRAFAGICDRDTIKVALDFLAKEPKAFAHVMTLDTHFPLGSRSAEDRDCKRIPSLNSPDLCLYANQLGGVLRTVGDAVRVAKIKPDIIYIYGDHAPPYAVASERQFFDRERVPFIILTRRAQ